MAPASPGTAGGAGVYIPIGPIVVGPDGVPVEPH